MRITGTYPKIIEDLIVDGNLVISGSLKNSLVFLKNVTVTGTLYIHSTNVHLLGIFNDVYISSPNTRVRLRNSGGTSIQNLTLSKKALGSRLSLYTSTKIENIYINASNAIISGMGRITNATMSAKNIMVKSDKIIQNIAPKSLLPALNTENIGIKVSGTGEYIKSDIDKASRTRLIKALNNLVDDDESVRFLNSSKIDGETICIILDEFQGKVSELVITLEAINGSENEETNYAKVIDATINNGNLLSSKSYIAKIPRASDNVAGAEVEINFNLNINRYRLGEESLAGYISTQFLRGHNETEKESEKPFIDALNQIMLSDNIALKWSESESVHIIEVYSLSNLSVPIDKALKVKTEKVSDGLFVVSEVRNTELPRGKYRLIIPASAVANKDYDRDIFVTIHVTHIIQAWSSTEIHIKDGDFFSDSVADEFINALNNIQLSEDPTDLVTWKPTLNGSHKILLEEYIHTNIESQGNNSVVQVNKCPSFEVTTTTSLDSQLVTGITMYNASEILGSSVYKLIIPHTALDNTSGEDIVISMKVQREINNDVFARTILSSSKLGLQLVLEEDYERYSEIYEAEFRNEAIEDFEYNNSSGELEKALNNLRISSPINKYFPRLIRWLKPPLDSGYHNLQVRKVDSSGNATTVIIAALKIESVTYNNRVDKVELCIYDEMALEDRSEVDYILVIPENAYNNLRVGELIVPLSLRALPSAKSTYKKVELDKDNKGLLIAY